MAVSLVVMEGGFVALHKKMTRTPGSGVWLVAAIVKSRRTEAISMNLSGYRLHRLNPAWEPCAHEILFHTSRYAGAAEHWLRDQADLPAFSLRDYRAQCLAPAQRRFAAVLMTYPLTVDTSRSVCWFVRQAASGRLACAACVAEDFLHCPRHARAEASLAEVAPCDPFLNMASRLHLRARVEGKCIWVSFSRLVYWLDASNPVIRGNLQDALSLLGRHGYRLRPRKG